MNVLLTQRDWIGLLVATLGLFGLVVVVWFVDGSPAIGLALVLGIAVVLCLLLQNRREVIQNRREMYQNRRQSELLFEQTEALFGLYFSMPRTMAPLPETRGWQASPDFLRLVYEEIRREEPNLVVELGSGSSTVIGGYALRQNGSGRLVSLEHLEEYSHKSRRLVSFHDLDDYSNILEAPLSTYQLNGENWKWYSLESFDPEEPIDLVIVDGPPGHLQELSRYPAFPLLSEWLSEEATFVVDDGDREDEKYIVEKWSEENPKFTYDYYDLEEGAYILYSKK